jgi:hypothetical protein
MLTVPDEEGPEEPLDLTDLDALVNPASQANGEPEPAAFANLDDTPQPESARPAAATATRPAPKPAAGARAAPPRQKRNPDDEPLLEEDVDTLLGLTKGAANLDSDDDPNPRSKPVSGADAMSLGDEPGKVVLSAQKATLLVVAVVVLLGVAFAAGFLIRSGLG